MTKERLVEACEFFNTETGVQDALQAARNTIKYFEKIEKDKPYPYSYMTEETVRKIGGIRKGDSNHCVLARAWKDGRRYVVVDYYFANLVGLGEGRQNHPFKDVITWYDGFFDHFTAAKAVVELLES